jgi:hypothetical protein
MNAAGRNAAAGITNVPEIAHDHAPEKGENGESHVLIQGIVVDLGHKNGAPNRVKKAAKTVERSDGRRRRGEH